MCLLIRTSYTRVNVVVLVKKVGQAINKLCMDNYVYNLIIYKYMQRMSYYIHVSVCYIALFS